MNEITRQKYLRVLDGEVSILPIMHQISNYRDADKILSWLIKNSLTGKEFKTWFNGNFQGSLLSMIKWVAMKNNKEKEYRPIMAGRDWK